jgi:hypothetical protein
MPTIIPASVHAHLASIRIHQFARAASVPVFIAIVTATVQVASMRRGFMRQIIPVWESVLLGFIMIHLKCVWLVYLLV